MTTSTTHRFLPLLAAGALAFASQAGAALVLHLDSRTGVTVTPSSTDVTSWADESGSGLDANVASSPAPQYPSATQINTNDVVNFDGSSHFLYRTGIAGSSLPSVDDDFHGFVVVRPDGDQAADWGAALAFGSGLAGDTKVSVGITGSGGGTPDRAWIGYQPVAPLVHGDTLSDNNTYIIEFYGDGNGSGSTTLGIRVNGDGLQTAGKTGLITSATDTFSVGHSTGRNIWFNGDIAEIRLYNSLLTDNERNIIGGTLQSDWGVSGSYVIPEPSSLMLIGLAGVAGLAFARKRR